eukprot:TRINITY_DN19220_c0_g1_i1.p1 TRINITY_DN19220_c0_g1~~TRINITY_DN19220_c0_g1_i1.p1  ORF type:complete len:305 (+),score=48.25 TRINITY_DN19220_c0_g1_i1:147-1061(+)
MAAAESDRSAEHAQQACEDLPETMDDSASGTGGTLSPEECIANLSRPYTGSPTARTRDPRMPGDSSGTAAAPPSEGSVMGAAAAIGGAAGMLLLGPVSAAGLAGAAAYATTRPGRTGATVRGMGKVGLKVADRAVDEGIKAVDYAFEEGRRRLSEGMDANALEGLPAPIRSGLIATIGVEKRPRQRSATGELSEEARRMRERYPDRVPVICERAPYADLPEISRKKFIVPGTMLCGEFKYIVHKNIVQATKDGLAADQTVYLFVNGISPKTGTPMSELYEQFRDADGFLYVSYGAENTLGCRRR